MLLMKTQVMYYVPIINNEFYTIFMEKDNSFKIKKRINKLCNKYKNKNDSLNNRVRDLITDLISTVSPSDDDTNLKICYLRKIDFRYTKKIKDK